MAANPSEPPPRTQGADVHADAESSDAPQDVSGERWTFLSNHSHVLICIAQHPDIRVSAIAQRVGIGERAVHRILSDLEQAGYVQRERQGRRNVYSVHLDRPLRHPLEASHRVAEAFGALIESTKTPSD
jgi:DNA-binding transcriptional ArsR family regulator